MSHLLRLTSHVSRLILDPSLKPLPSLKRHGGEFRVVLLGGNGALRMGFANLLIDKSVVEAGVSSNFARSAIVDTVGTRPINRPEAHRTGFAAGVELATGKLECSEVSACVADGLHLRMRRGVVVYRHHIAAAPHNLAVLHHHRPERTACTCLKALVSQTDGFFHEIRIVHFRLFFRAQK